MIFRMYLRRFSVFKQLSFVSLLAFFVLTTLFSQNINDKPQIAIKPGKLHIYFDDTTRFITEKVKVINSGTSPLIIRDVKGSCNCATSMVARSTIHPTTVGQIYLYIDAVKVTDSLMRLDYIIRSNAKDSVLLLPVILHKKKTKFN